MKSVLSDSNLRTALENSLLNRSCFAASLIILGDNPMSPAAGSSSLAGKSRFKIALISSSLMVLVCREFGTLLHFQILAVINNIVSSSEGKSLNSRGRVYSSPCYEHATVNDE